MRYNYLILFFLITGSFSCQQHTNTAIKLEHRIDSLQIQLANTYKPGFGEFMTDVQIHHAKLWFAGEQQNWALANFEVNEIEEAITGIKTYCQDRSETKEIDMINQPLDHLDMAIQQKSPEQFKNSYMLLTKTCNNCHQSTNHAFNVITVPTLPPFSNQVFSLPVAK
jgi:hypothetical protein